MPSRRRLLAALATVGSGALAGCFAPDERSTGVVWRKGVRVEQQYGNGRFANTSALDVRVDTEAGVLRAEYDPRYVSFDETHTTFSAAVDDELDTSFDDHWYYVNVESDGEADPANGATNRSDCNAVTVGGRATATTHECPDRRDCVRVFDTDPRFVDVTDVKRHQFDVDAYLAELRDGE
jgi:hypothetical protein